jgi:hypothetical protein
LVVVCGDRDGWFAVGRSVGLVWWGTGVGRWLGLRFADVACRRIPVVVWARRGRDLLRVILAGVCLQIRVW